MINGLWCDSPGYEGGILLSVSYALYYHDWTLIPEKKRNLGLSLDLEPSYFTTGRVSTSFETRLDCQSQL